MKITRCATAVVEANYDYTFVRVHAENGVYGTGECFFAAGLTAALHEMYGLLIGRDAREVDRLARFLWRKGSGAGAVAGYLYNAISGIETALWDLLGKSTGLPVYQFLGGKLRDLVRVYADCHAADNLESWGPMLTPREPRWLVEATAGKGAGEDRYEPALYRRRAASMVERGFDLLKFDIDSIVIRTGEELFRPLHRHEMDRMVECVAAARDGAGDRVDLAIDCHWRFAPTEAIRIARALAPFNLIWLEDPCAPENWRDIRDVRRASRCPILTGENLNRRHGFWDLITNRACDIVAPDFQKCGGLLEGKRIGELAELQGVRVAPHNIASPLGTIAGAHVCSTLPNFVALEFHGSDVPFWNDLIRFADAARPVIENGRIRMTDAPGLGCELNEDEARKYGKAGECFFDV
jgi:L-alanine-DL-glutamate epimerase-like enolase superfamily enzyme